MTNPAGVHTADDQMPPLGDDLQDLFDDLAAVQDPGADQMLAGLRYMALNRYTTDETQTRIAWAGGGADGTNFLTLLGKVIARLADADTNPALRSLPLEQQKNARREGQNAAYWLADPDLHQTASDTCAAIDGA